MKSYQEVFNEGAEAYLEGLDKYDNPYDPYKYSHFVNEDWAIWEDGWLWQREKDKA